LLFSQCSRHHPDLHSFPTRRSSDLATLDTAGSLLRGTERIRYENHSPDTLRFVWVQIEQNIFAQNSATYALNQPPLHLAGGAVRSEEHTSELQSRFDLVCRLLLEKK